MQDRTAGPKRMAMMTFHLGTTYTDALLAIARTRVLSGFEMSEDEQGSVSECETHAIFVLTSGL